jgi:hypothetical protein
METEGADNPSLVATHVHTCLVDYQGLCDNLARAETHIKQKVPPGVIKDELGRFGLWSGNVGAHRRGRGSLDHKLREASRIREQVINLLQEIKFVLQEATEIVTGERVSGEDMSDSDSDTTENGKVELPQEDTTELQQLATNLAELNTCLMRLSISIRNPAPHDQFKMSANIDTTYYEQFDIAHVQGKFPNAEEHLSVRLGKAISRRRQYLRYRDDHRKKYEQGLPQIGAHREVASTIVSSLPPALKALDVSIADLDEDEYDDTQSVTSYASSGHDPEKLRPPPLPKRGEDGKPFECPLCFRFTVVQHVKAWHRHVYRDLQPYVSSPRNISQLPLIPIQVCTLDGCEVPDRTYESRHEWFRHETQVHRKWWQCVDGCNKSSQWTETLREHIRSDHTLLATGGRLDDLVRSCERHRSMATTATCPLCQDTLSTLTLLRRHLGKHLEELSLFAVPLHVNENEEKDEDEGDRSEDEGSSTASSGSSSPPAIIACEIDGCKAVFKGLGKELYLGMHRAREHKGPAVFCCDKHVRHYITGMRG